MGPAGQPVGKKAASVAGLFAGEKRGPAGNQSGCHPGKDGCHAAGHGGSGRVRHDRRYVQQRADRRLR